MKNNFFASSALALSVGLFFSPASRAAISLRISESNEMNSGCDLVIAGFETKESFLDFYRHLRMALEKKDVNALAKLALYPMNTRIGEKKVELKNEEEFKKNFKLFFTEDVVRAVQRQEMTEIFCTKKGVQIGHGGQLWIQIDEKKKVGIRTVNP